MEFIGAKQREEGDTRFLFVLPDEKTPDDPTLWEGIILSLQGAHGLKVLGEDCMPKEIPLSDLEEYADAICKGSAVPAAFGVLNHKVQIVEFGTVNLMFEVSFEKLGYVTGVRLDQIQT